MSDLFYKRTRFQQELAEALIESKAINIESIATIIGRYGERAVLEGDTKMARGEHAASIAGAAAAGRGAQSTVPS